jgi:hypothetical protein
MTPEEIDRLVEDDHDWNWDALHAGEDIEVPGLGTVVSVEQHGGEGEGDQYWVVVRIGDRYFRKPGWYASHDGGYLDGDLYEVTPETRTVVVYE